MTATDRRACDFRTILFCTDFSRNADLAFDYALDVARRRPEAVLHVLHVVPEAEAQFWNTYLAEVEDVDEKARRDVQEKLAQGYLSRVPEGMNVQVHVRVGKDYAEILAFAREHGVDLLIMGRHGKSALGEFFFGAVTEKVARKADCAVLIVPLSFAEKPEPL